MWAAIIGVIIIYILVMRCSKPQYFPPGPTPLPVLGNILSVYLEVWKLKNHFKVWQLWSRRYGQILGLRLGFTNVVVVSGKEYIKEVLSREVFQGRPDGFLYTMRSFGKKLGVVFSDGHKWSKTRRFVLKYLKSFGYNTRYMDTYVKEECKALVQLRTRDAGRPVLVNTMFHVTIVNILWRLVAGKRYNLEDVRLNYLCSLVTKLFKAVDMSGSVLTFLPFLRHVIPNLIGYTKLRAIHNELHNFIQETIKEHHQTIDLKHPRDVIDAFIIEAIEQHDDSLTEEDLQVICLDMLEAGMETVSNTAVFMLLHIVRNDDVQRKLQQEIDDVIGQTRSPDMEDRARMVYTEAVLLETLRISTVAAVGIPHMALEDARLGNYIIPKGAIILLAMYDLHNGDHWRDPEMFRPERFLTKEGNLLQDEWLLPFGTGKRRCIGEALARSELFMFVAHLLQKFELRVPDGEPPPSSEPLDGLTLSAKPFSIVFKPRF